MASPWWGGSNYGRGESCNWVEKLKYTQQDLQNQQKGWEFLKVKGYGGGRGCDNQKNLSFIKGVVEDHREFKS